MISRVFIDRPIFAMVLSIVLTLAGGLAVFGLPIAQYPEITPPVVNVTGLYPGANAQTVAETVGAPIEQQVVGVERMLYMSSQSSNDGRYNLDVTFSVGTNIDMAQVLVQNRVAMADPQLPEEVKRNGVTVKKKSPSILLVVNLISPDGRYDQLYLSNYATIQIKDQLSRLEGVGDVAYFGQRDYSMRAWLDPEQLAARRLTAGDVVAALREQNVQVAAGQIGREPNPEFLDFQYVVGAQGRLIDPEEFASIVVKTGQRTGDVVRLKDVGRIELGSKDSDVDCRLDGKPSVGLAVFQLPGSNALETAERIQQRMEELSRGFPQGLEYKIAYDTTPFIDESIHEVFKALRDAIILVAIVVLVFLQGWRSTLIPLIAVPVSIVGTFAVMSVAGFSLNNLSLFGLVLAIGIVVDDAIVVVENVERWLHEGLSPREATLKAMQEVTGPVVAVALVLCAVFVPCAFITGVTGQFFRQFALTIAVSTVISAFNSLTLSPALAAMLLVHKEHDKSLATRLLDGALGWFFKGFNKLFDAIIGGYGAIVSRLLKASVLVLVVYCGLLYLTADVLGRLPAGFIPSQDKGYCMVPVQLPDSASLKRTQEVVAKVEQIALATEGVQHTLSIAGQSMLLNSYGTNLGTVFVIFEPFEERHARVDQILAALRQRFYAEIPEAQVLAFGAPPVDGLGSAGGFKLMLQDKSDQGFQVLGEQAAALGEAGNATPGLVGLFSSFRSGVPTLYADIDRVKCKQMGVGLDAVFQTLQVYLGGQYVNDFVRFGRTWQVNLQADADFRARPEDLGLLKVRNGEGQMVPLGTVAKVEDRSGPMLVLRYNMYPAAPINGSTAPGMSSGEAVSTMDALAEKSLPPGMGIEWTELTYLQIQAGSTAMIVFALATLLVFLTLAAQYESWSLPFAVVLVVPMCLLCSGIGVAIAGLDVNIFTQIGFVVLVGLASKNAILIVEFAKALREQGKEAGEATVEACRLRLRPILMTSFAFILGVVPLMLGSGAGSEMRFTLGTAVFSGMLGVTVFGVFLTPVFFYVLARLVPAKPKPAGGEGHEGAAPAAHAPSH